MRHISPPSAAIALILFSLVNMIYDIGKHASDHYLDPSFIPDLPGHIFRHPPHRSTSKCSLMASKFRPAMLYIPNNTNLSLLKASPSG